MSCYLCNLVHLHHLVTVVTDDLDRNFACCGFWEWPACDPIEGFPRFVIDLRPQRLAQLFIWVCRALPSEVGVANEECLSVVVGVDEPTRDVVRGAVPDIACRRVIHIQAL